MEVGTAIDKMTLAVFEWKSRPGAFSHLTELSARVPLDQSLTSLLSDIGGDHSLTTLRLVYAGRHLVHLKSLMRAVASHSLPRHLSLSRLRTDTSDADMLRSIACLILLESLEIHNHSASNVADNDIGDLLENLPLLKRLQLRLPDWWEKGWTRLMLQTLILTCTYCPLLEHIALLIDARQEFIPSKAQEQPNESKPRVPTLECTMCQPCSPIDALEVAAFLSQLRPIDVRVKETDDKSSPWDEVDGFMQRSGSWGTM
ncbi:hypothetical protein FRB94_005176 [Tulasnella sp. JGI-2019a]|nr:hypothetical protein FRB93_004892 [Tulasnella sp. JGI-2019a]KAG9000796.1 hypothetical protein FRB94_005176 [Tulasnella sp. JGI-2019a]